MTLRIAKETRQRIVDDYLATTGRDSYVPAEFISWLQNQPNHEAYGWFFSISDEDAAFQHRLAMAREFVSGLRITIAYSTAPLTPMIPGSIRSREEERTELKFPSMISPRATRSSGGGYVPVDLDDPAIKQELHGQAAQELRAWLNRFGGVCTMSGIDPASIESIAVQVEQAGMVVPA